MLIGWRVELTAFAVTAESASTEVSADSLSVLVFIVLLFVVGPAELAVDCTICIANGHVDQISIVRSTGFNTGARGIFSDYRFDETCQSATSASFSPTQS